MSDMLLACRFRPKNVGQQVTDKLKHVGHADILPRGNGLAIL